MTKSIELPVANWTTALADAINQDEDGDTIACRTASQAESGESARQRMCPDKNINFTYEVDDLDEFLNYCGVTHG